MMAIKILKEKTDKRVNCSPSLKLVKEFYQDNLLFFNFGKSTLALYF